MAGPKFRRLLKLSCGALAAAGLGPDDPEPWVERGVFLPEANGDGDGRRDAKEGIAEAAAGVGFEPWFAGAGSQLSPARSSMVLRGVSYKESAVL